MNLPDSNLIPLANPASEMMAECLGDYGLSQAALSAATGIPAQTISDIIHGRRNLTVNQALRLGHYFGNGAGIWLRMQTEYLLRMEERKAKEEIDRLPTLTVG